MREHRIFGLNCMVFLKLLFFGLLAGPVLAQPLVIHGSFRTRVEAWDWFDGAASSEYAFSGNQARFSLGQTMTVFHYSIVYLL